MFAFGSKAAGYESDRRDYTGHESVGVDNSDPSSRYQAVIDAQARYYIPGLGIFASVDPLGDQYPEISPYAYVKNDPISNTDPTGMSINNEYVRDTETGEVRKISDVGGNEIDYICEGRHVDENTSVYDPMSVEVVDVNTEYDVGPGDDSPLAQSKNPTPGHRYTHGRTHTDLLAYGALASLFTGTPVSGVLGAASKRQTFKTGSQRQRDQTIFQYPNEFRRWYHKQYKKPGDKDATKSELKEISEDWTQQGRPSGD